MINPLLRVLTADVRVSTAVFMPFSGVGLYLGVNEISENFSFIGANLKKVSTGKASDLTLGKTLVSKDCKYTLECKEYDWRSGENSTLTPNKKRYICLRTVDGTAIEKDAYEHYIKAKEALDKIKSAQ